MAWALLFVCVSSGQALANGPQGVVFREAREGSGVDYVNVSGEPEKHHILSTLGSGVALFDYDEDGDLDLYFANGAAIEGGRVKEVAADRLYRNEGGWSFVDVTGQAGLGDTGWGVGVTAADYDDDGLPDLYVTRIGRNLLYRNRGDGTFEELAERTGVADPHWGTSAAFFDADRDGDLDLYVDNYVDVDLENIPPPGQEARCQWFGLEIMCGPKGLPGTSDVFFLNRGDGTFGDATEAAGLGDPTGAYALGVVTGDYDDDGDLDLYVANDSAANFLYQNDGRGHFTESAFLSGVALSSDGLAQAGMGVDMGDLNGDGRLDLFVTNFSHEPNNAYLNHGHGLFLDAVGEANLHGASWFALGWGTRLIDFDHDGDLDVFVANGHVYPGVDRSNLKTRYHQANQIFWNDGAGVFSEHEFAPGDAMRRFAASRSAAFGDVDGDGDVDGVIVNIDAAPSLLVNELEGERQGVLFRLVGTRGPRDAIGARITVEAGHVRQMREIHPSGSFLASSDGRAHFGWSGVGSVDRVQVRWPGGRVESFSVSEAGIVITLVEGTGDSE